PRGSYTLSLHDALPILGVVDHGTGTAADLAGRQVAGKTGTTENYQDAWFVGYTPELATAVWMGDPSGEVPMRDVQGINVVGGSLDRKSTRLNSSHSQIS